MKILIIKPSSLGDVVHALPILRLLKQQHPQSEIHWCIDSYLAPLLENDPDLTGLLPFIRHGWASPAQWWQGWSTLHKARQLRFDWVIDLQALARSGLMAWWANGEFTIGLDDRREGASLFYDVAVPRPSPDTHAVDWYRAVLPYLGVPVHWNFEWLPIQPHLAEAVRSQWPLGAQQIVILQPGARWNNKRWPVEYFRTLVAELLRRRPELHFVILGGKSDQAAGLGKAIAAAGHCLDLTGRVSLPEMIEWIRVASLMISNDTGPMHVAAALRKPVVALFGPTSPQRTGPYGQIDRVLQMELPCVPCLKSSCHYHRPLACLRDLRPEMVVAEVEKRLGRC